MTAPRDHDPQKLLEIGDTMLGRLIQVVIEGYAKQEPEDEMVLTTFHSIEDHIALPTGTGLTAAMLTAAIFQIAKDSKWNLVMENKNGTRVVIHCDTEEEQNARALAIMTKEQLS